MKKYPKHIIIVLGLCGVLLFGFAALRYRAIQVADAYMRDNLPEWWKLYSARLDINDKRLGWTIQYDVDALTGTPPWVELSLGGTIIKSNVRPMKNGAQQAVPGYPPQGVGSPEP